MTARPLIALTAAALALYAAHAAAQSAAAAEIAADTSGEGGDGSTAIDYLDPFGALMSQADNYMTGRDMDSQNVQAFLSLIAYSEGTTARGGDSYRVCYGYSHTIQSMADHPAVTGEWRGLPLSDAMCKGAGMRPGCVSTAAGRYQMIRPTWLTCKRALGLPDFSPDSQDRAALYLITKRGALDDVKAGRIAAAIDKCRAEWASLPGAGYGQPERRLSALLAAYSDAGGVVSA